MISISCVEQQITININRVVLNIVYMLGVLHTIFQSIRMRQTVYWQLTLLAITGKNRSELGDRMAIVGGTDIESRQRNLLVAGF